METMLGAQKIIIDTDPGQDDAVAILLALASPKEIEVLGITAVAGNVPLYLTEKNARIVCELANNTDVKVFAGCDTPMNRPLVTAEHVHGKTGLDGPSLPDPEMPLQKQHAVDFIIETIRENAAGTITLCPLGPLTNIATAIEKAPSISPFMNLQPILKLNACLTSGSFSMKPAVEKIGTCFAAKTFDKLKHKRSINIL